MPSKTRVEFRRRKRTTTSASASSTQPSTRANSPLFGRASEDSGISSPDSSTCGDLPASSKAPPLSRQTSSNAKGKKKAAVYDRFGAVLHVPLVSRTAHEALAIGNVLWEWEDVDASPSQEQSAKLAFDLPAFLQAIQPVVGEVLGIAEYASGLYHTVHVVQTADKHYAARFDLSKEDADRRLEREVAVMRLARDAGVPVPEIIAFDSTGRHVGAPWLLMEWIEGIDRPWAYLDEADKEAHVCALAAAMAAIFNAPLNEEKIGSVASYEAGTSVIEPSLNLVAAPTMSEFDYPDSLESYLAWLCQRATDTEAGSDFSALSLHESRELVDRFRRLIVDAMGELDEGLSADEVASLRRMRLVHGDADRNIITQPGSPAIQAIIDWEFSMCLPALLAAHYPGCISREGLRDERWHVVECEAFGNAVWEERRDRASRLRKTFEEAAELRDPAYALALRRGRRLRELADWLTNWQHDDDYRTCAASFASACETKAGRPIKASLSLASLTSLSR